MSNFQGQDNKFNRSSPENYDLINALRILISAVVLLIAFIVPGIHSAPMIGMATGALAFSAGWFLMEHLRIIDTASNPALSFIPTAFDLTFITFFVMVTGSINSILIFGYYFSILIGSQSIRSRQGLFAAFLAFVLFSGSSISIFTGLFPAINLLGGNSSFNLASMLITLSLNGIGFFAIHAMSRKHVGQIRMLIEKLEHSGLELSRQNNIIKLLLHDYENQSSDWLFELDPELRVTYISEKAPDTFRAIFFPDAKVEYIPENCADDCEGIESGLETLFKTGKPFENAQIKTGKDDGARWLEITAIPIPGPSGSDGRPGWRGVGRETTDKRQLEMQIHRLAFTDDRTSLPNRNKFITVMDGFLSGSIDAPENGILGIMKLDNLDHLRGNLSALSIDQLLTSFVDTARNALGTTFILARLEYNEFAFWTGESSLDSLEHVHSLNRMLRQAIPLGNESFTVHTRIGVAFFPVDGKNRQELFKAADLALNSLAENGDNRVARYSRKFSDIFIRRMELSRDFWKSLDAGDYSVRYQPQVYSGDRTLYGAEALVRWHHPSKGNVSPGEFIPLAEQHGFITELDEWVLTQSCIDAAAWTLPLGLSVNVSGAQLRNPHRLDRAIIAALEQSGLPASRLTLEITESSLLEEKEDASSLLRKLKKLGIGIALDDFGTGYSSLSYIQDLPLDKLKIDQSFIRRLENDSGSEKIVGTIIALAHGLGMKTVSEGVELPGQADILGNMGNDYLQGYLYGKPVTAMEFAEAIRLQELQHRR